MARAMREPWAGELNKAWKRAFDSLGGRKLVVENMDISERAAGFLRPRLGRQIFVSLLRFALLFAARPQNLSAQHDSVC